MPDLDIGELERLAKAATPGPWVAKAHPESKEPDAVYGSGAGKVAYCQAMFGRPHVHHSAWSSNAALIAAANPAVILAWAEQHRALIAENEELERDIDAISKQAWEADDRVSALIAEREALREIEVLARELITSGLVNRGVDRGLVVVEKADKSDPHYRLCLALEARAGSKRKPRAEESASPAEAGSGGQAAKVLASTGRPS